MEITIVIPRAESDETNGSYRRKENLMTTAINYQIHHALMGINIYWHTLQCRITELPPITTLEIF